MSDDSTEPTLSEIARIAAPYRREIVLHDARWPSGMRLLRIRIREGHRFTIMDIDPHTATEVAAVLGAWTSDVAKDPEAGKDGGS